MQVGKGKIQKEFTEKSAAILKKFLGEKHLLRNESVARSMAEKGETLHNLTWAINHDHTKEYAISVYNRLKEANSRAQVIKALNEIAEVLNRGDKFRYGNYTP